MTSQSQSPVTSVSAMFSSREAAVWIIIQCLILWKFCPPVFDYITCQEPEVSVLDQLFLMLEWREIETICPSETSFKTVMLTALLSESLMLNIMVLRILAPFLRHKRNEKVQREKNSFDGQGKKPTVSELLFYPPVPPDTDTFDESKFQSLRPDIPVKEMTEVQFNREWENSHVYMEFYSHCLGLVNPSGVIR